MESNTTITSKFRIDYWIMQSISYVAGLFLIGLCLYFSFDNGKIDYHRSVFWIAILGIWALVFYFLKFLLNEFKQITISDKGIEIKYLLTKKTDVIPYNEIVKFTTRRITSRQGVGRTTGYHELEIELTKDRVITFSENQFDNYNEIKNTIYRNCKFPL